MSITVLDPVPLTTVQDAGRVGYAAQGYRSCGAADSYAYHLANALVGNDPGRGGAGIHPARPGTAI